MVEGKRGPSQLNPRWGIAFPTALSTMSGGAPAVAHVADDFAGVPTITGSVTLDPWILVPLLLMFGLYGVGLSKLWRGGVGRGVTVLEAMAFGAGCAILLLALVSPLDAYGEWSLAAHMTQHMLLLSVAPPLLLLGLPLAVSAKAVPSAAVQGMAGRLRRGAARPAWTLLVMPAVAMLLQGGAMWIWHVPAALAAALESPLVHIAMHASFLLVGLLFWASVLRSVRQPDTGAGGAAIALVGTMMQMGLLGALLTFAQTPLYPHYVERAPHLGLSALEDQQLAGLIMWVPAALPYVVGGIVLMAVWLRRGDRHDRAAKLV